jgi:hypothetical protein
LGGVSGGKETQGWRDSSHTAMVGAGKFGSAKLPMATVTYPGKPSFSYQLVRMGSLFVFRDAAQSRHSFSPLDSFAIAEASDGTLH